MSLGGFVGRTLECGHLRLEVLGEGRGGERLGRRAGGEVRKLPEDGQGWTGDGVTR